MWDAVKRTRATVKGTNGDDSTEYKLIGGTRMSERRRSVRRAQESWVPFVTAKSAKSAKDSLA
jgi:hypothetical protein